MIKLISFLSLSACVCVHVRARPRTSNSFPIVQPIESRPNGFYRVQVISKQMFGPVCSSLCVRLQQVYRYSHNQSLKKKKKLVIIRGAIFLLFLSAEIAVISIGSRITPPRKRCRAQPAIPGRGIRFFGGG